MYIYGKNTIVDIFEKNPAYIKKVFIDKVRHQSLYDKLKKAHIELIDFSSFNFRAHFKNNENLQGIVALIEEPKFLSLKELINKNSKKQSPVILILDQIMDPQNFGAILRNCAAFDADGVIFSSQHSSPLSSVAMKASSGTWINLNLCQVNSLNSIMNSLKENGYWIVSTSLEGKDDLKFFNNFNQPIALILGNEGKGVRKTLQDKSDIKIKINISKNVNSLNVAATSAILLHYIKNNNGLK